MTFSEVLKDLMIDKEITIKELARDIEMHFGSLYYYFKHNTIPDVNCAIKLSEYFNCSINYLLGLDEHRQIDKPKISKKFIEIYEELLRINNVTNFKVCKVLNINRNSIYNWRKGNIPKMYNLITIANYFNVTVDFLLGRSEY